MDQEKELQSLLKKYLRLLKKERRALIEDEGHLIEGIVKEKQAFSKLLSEYQTTNNEDTTLLIRQVRALQTTNLLLTEQALSYQESLLGAVSQSVQQSNGTYSRSGNVDKQTDSSLMNQSF